MTQEVALECFQMGEMVNIGQCDGEHQVGKPSEFYLLKYSNHVVNFWLEIKMRLIVINVF